MKLKTLAVGLCTIALLAAAVQRAMMPKVKKKEQDVRNRCECNTACGNSEACEAGTGKKGLQG